MNWWRKVQVRLRALFQKRKLDAEMDEEMRLHIEMQTQENIDAGMNPEEARYAARRQFGWVESIKETCRERRGVGWIEHLIQDVRYGSRMLLKNPGSTVLAVLILALGIGGNTAVFSVVDKAILNPIPGKEADKLIALQEVDVLHDARWNVSPPLFVELSTQTNIFAALSAYFQGPETVTLERGADAVKLRGARTSPGFFDILDVRPVAGRTFLRDEGRQGNDGVLVASYGLWRQHFGGDPKFIGSTIILSGRAYTVVGIMPATFQFPFSQGENQFWIPHIFTPEESTNPEYNRNRVWAVIGRLQDGASLEQAHALLDTVAQRSQKDFAEANRKWVIEAKPARTMFVGPTLERTLWSLQASVLMLLLISCANVGTLLVSRAAARRGEFSIRMAIGAGRFRVIRQLITESLALAAVAGLFGVFFAWGGIHALDHFYLGNLPRMRAVGLDGSVLAVMAMVSTLTGLVFGVAPAWLVSRLCLSDSLKNTSQQQSGGFLQRLFQDGLVVLQVSLAVVLLVGAGLMIQSVVRLLRVNPGLDPHGLYYVRYEMMKWDNETDFRENLRRWLLWRESMVERLRAVPGVESAAIVTGAGTDEFRVEGWDKPVRLGSSSVGVRSGDYLRTLRVSLVAGRLLTEQDCVSSPQAVVINRELARRCWHGQNPLGKRLAGAGQDTVRDYVVVGVVENVLDWGKDADPQPAFYEPIERTDLGKAGMNFMVRGNADMDSLHATAKRLGKEMSPPLDLFQFYSVEAQFYASTAPRRIYMWLLSTMGGLGLLLSALGMYAIMAYAVVRRTREIGVRMALGATRGNIARLILGRGARLVLNGLVLGVAAALGLAQYMESLLYQVKPGDPWAFVEVLLALGTVTGIACYIPARRAASVGPMEALRYE